MILKNGASRPVTAQQLPCCFLLLLFAFDITACGWNRDHGNGRWRNMAAACCFNDRLEASPTGCDTRAVDERSTGFRGAGLVPDDLAPSGSIEILQADTVIEGMDISGSVEVKAPRVTVRNSRIRSSDHFPVRVFPGGSLTIEYTEIIGTSSCGAAVAPGNYTARRLDVHGTTDGFRAGSNVTIEGCYIHDLSVSGGSHNDGIQQLSGSNVLIRNNYIQAPPGSTSAIMIATDTGPIDNVLIDSNIVNGGGYILYSRIGYYVPAGAPTNVRITNNRLGRDFEHGLFSIDGSVTFSSNVWVDNGQAVPHP